MAEGAPALQGNLTTLRFTSIFDLTKRDSYDIAGFTDYSVNEHIYKATWTPTAVTFYVDGSQTAQDTTVANIPSHPCFMVMDIECADAFAGDVVLGNFPQVYQVEYVKAWDSNGNLIFYDEFDGSPAIQIQNSYQSCVHPRHFRCWHSFHHASTGLCTANDNPFLAFGFGCSRRNECGYYVCN